MSTSLRQAWLRTLALIGVRSFVARSGLGHSFVCHIGDFLGENPFYNRQAFRVELELCAAWLREETDPLVFDVGANVGFWATHLVQMIDSSQTRVFAFEPVAETVAKLVSSIGKLGLEAQVLVVAAAVANHSRPVRLSYSSQRSLFAQVENEGPNRRAGDRTVYSASVTLDAFSETFGLLPFLIKVDIEGSEIAALRGAMNLLARDERPCLMFEYNPGTLSEMKDAPSDFANLLGGYLLFYVDDFSGQIRPIGDSVTSLGEIDWVCNLFAVPNNIHSISRWERALAATRSRMREG